MSHKHHVTIEECIDEEDIRQMKKACDMAEIDLCNINQNQSSNTDSYSRGSKRQAWDEVDALEEQARLEKMQDQSTAMANAMETSRIVKEAQQCSGY